MCRLLRYFALFPGILIISLSTSFSQQRINFSRYFNEDVLPTLEPDDYVPLEFDWKMPGNIQASMNAGLTELEEENYGAASENFLAVKNALPTFHPGFYYLGVALKAQLKFSEAENALRNSISLSKDCWQCHLQLAEALQLQGKFAEAEKEYNNATAANPRSPEPSFYLGHLELLKGNQRKAFKFYEKTTEINPDFAKGYVMQGLIKMPDALRKGDALEYFNRALAADSLCKEALFWRGLYYIIHEEPQVALKDWDKLVQTNPNVMRFLMLRGFLNIEMERYDYAFADMRKAATFHKADEEKFRGGQTLLDKQIDIQYATQYAMRNSYGLNPESFGHFKKGFCLFIAGNHEKAIEEFKRAELTQNAAVIFYLHAITLEHAGKHPAAYDLYTRALALDDDIFDAHKKRAIYRTELKDWKGANQDFNAMLRIQPESAITYKLRAFTKLSFKEYYGCIIDLTKFLKSDSTDSEVYLNRGYCHDQVQNPKGAADDYVQAIRYDSSNAGLFGVTSDQLLKAKDSARALEFKKIRTRKFPDEIAGWVDLANLQMMMEQFKEGHASIDHAISIISSGEMRYSPLFSRALQIKGMLFFHQQNYKSAIKEFTKAIEASPMQLEAQYYRGKSYILTREKILARKDFKELGQKGYLDSQEIYTSLLAR
jgi:tetratricopeptide (TPR) repeat protein